MAGNLDRRLAELERNLTALLRETERGSCVCRTFTTAIDPEKVEAEMNVLCPRHGVRRLGTIFRTVIVGSKGVVEDPAKQEKLDALIERYENRIAQAELEYESSEP